MTMITLHWQKCIKNSLWCQCNEKLLNDGRLESRLGDHSVGISGVYVLWTGIDNRTVLKVGSGLSKINWQHISETLKFKPINLHDCMLRGLLRYLQLDQKRYKKA